MNEKKMIVGYLRLSEEDIGKENEYSISIYNQKKIINSYVDRMGLKIDKFYIDDGYSGINFDRPAFIELKNDINKSRIGIVITKDMSRLGRDFIETAYYISEYFPCYGVRYISISDEYDSDDSSNNQKDIMLGIRSIINDRYVKDTSLKRKQVALSKTKHGEYIGFMAPYGYKIVKSSNKRTLEIDEEAALVVKRIFNSIASGKSRLEVAHELNNDQILPPIKYLNMMPVKGKKYYYDWTDKIIYRILKNKTYIGSLVVRKSKKDNYRDKKRKTVAIRDRETIPNSHPSIISEELFEEANAKLRTNQRKKKNNYDGTFSNIIVCGICGKVMSVCRKERNNRVLYYFKCSGYYDRKRCPNRTIYDSKLRIVIEDTIKELIDTFVDVDYITDKMSKELFQKNRYKLKIDNIKKAIELYNNDIRNLYVKKAKGEITLDDFISEKTKKDMEKDSLERQLDNLIYLNNIDISKNEVFKYYNKFIDRNIISKEYIRDIIDKITIYKESSIQISFKFRVGKTKKIKLYS